MEPPCVFQRLITHLRGALHDALQEVQPHTKDSLFKFVIRKKIKNLHQGDVVVPAGCLKLQHTHQEQVMAIMKQYCDRPETLTTSVACDKYSFVTFFIDRPMFCHNVLEQVSERGQRYGLSDSKSDTVVSIHTVTCDKTSSLLDMRLAVVKYHAFKLLEANGYTVHIIQPERDEFEQLMQTDQGIMSEEESDSANSKTPDASPSCQFMLSKLDFISSSETMCSRNTDTDSKSTKSSQELGMNENLMPVFSCENEGDVFVNLQQVIFNRHLHQGKGGYDANLKSVQVLRAKQTTQVMEECMKIANSIPSFSLEKKHHCLHVVPQGAAFVDQQILLVLNSLAEGELSQSQMVVGPINVQEASSSPSSSSSAQDFYKCRFSQFKEASEMRNGVDSKGCDDDVQSLTDASIKIDILGNACSSPLTLENSASDRGAESRLGAFILYNTARLSTLLKRFDQEVAKGTYPPLPSVDHIDWSLLREEEDWELVYVYVSAFPELVSQSVECACPEDGKLSAKIHTHKVTNFLVSFCKCLSAHYSRYHILTGRESHLHPLMFARLHMMKAAHQVLLNSLNLIGVKALSYL